MGHRRRVMEPLIANLRAGGSIDVYEDVYCSSILLDAARRGDLTPDDTLLMLSIDGAQLYQSKQSDCWIYIWVLLDIAPDLHYKEEVRSSGQLHSWPQKTQESGFFRLHWVASPLGATKGRPARLGLLNWAHLYFATVLLLGHCRRTWSGSSPWTSRPSWRVWM